MRTPLFDQIAEHIGRGIAGFHTPGHQQGSGCSEEYKQKISEYLLKMDLTELDGLDNLKHPLGCIKKAQDLAAGAFGARQTYFLVNGSTVGLQAAILALNRTREKMIVSRQAHISIVNAFVLSGGMPVVAPVEVNYEWGIPLGTPLEKLTWIMAENPTAKAMVYAQPSYQGIGCDFSKIKEVTTGRGIALVVDEAHGAHLFFQNRVPLSAQKQQADLVIQSTHKTLSALTQASMLHVNSDKWLIPIRRALDILQTTSPSYLLMASLDCVQGQMRNEGTALIARTMELAETLSANIRKISGYRIFADELSKPWFCDPTKIAISAHELGLTGWELAAILRKDYGIEVELSDYFYILVLVTIGHSYADIIKLTKALEQIRTYERKKSVEVLPQPANIFADDIVLSKTPRQVYEHETEKIPLKEAAGRVAAEPLTVYPPGIPLVWPGQIIETKHLDYLFWAKACGFQVQGIQPGEMITVI